MLNSQDQDVAEQTLLPTDENNWFKRPENAALAPALFATIIPLVLGNVPELVPFGSEMGSFLSVLGYSYLGAWIFNLLIVVIPRNNRLYEAHSAAWPTLGMIALESERALLDLAYLIDPDDPQYEVSPQGARDLAERIPVGTISGPHLYGRDEKALQQIETRLEVVREGYRSLIPILPLFEHELIIRLARFSACNLVRNPITLDEINDETKLFDPATKTLVTNNLSGRYGSDLAEYVEASLSVHEYLKGIKRKPGPIGYGLHLVLIDQDMYQMDKKSTQSAGPSSDGNPSS